MIVVIAVSERQVITDQFNIAPVTGRMGIFARTNAPTETKHDVEIVGVYSNHETAVLAGQAHAARHPNRKYVTKVCALNDELPEPPVTPKCIKCGIDNPGGHSFCAKCNQIHLRECAQTDVMPNAPNPVVKTTFGQPMTPNEPPRLLNGAPV